MSQVQLFTAIACVTAAAIGGLLFGIRIGFRTCAYETTQRLQRWRDMHMDAAWTSSAAAAAVNAAFRGQDAEREGTVVRVEDPEDQMYVHREEFRIVEGRRSS